MPRITGIVFATALIISVPVLAHHSLQATFDVSQQVQVSGVVNEYRFVNPHARLSLEVQTDDGRTERWVAEGGAVQVLRRKGWTGDEFSPGDRVTVDGNPAKDGSLYLNILSIRFTDGRNLTFEDIDFDAIDELRRERRR